MNNIFKRVCTTAAAFLFPPRCVFCRKYLTVPGAIICTSCAGTLPAHTLSRTRSKAPHLEYCMHPFTFDGLVRKSILRFKFNSKTFYAPTYAKFAHVVYDNFAPAPPPLYITWVPISRKRQQKRGYNQAEVFANALSKELSIPCRPLLKKVIDNKAQSGLSKARRAANVLGAYELSPPQCLTGFDLILVDDIFTTGATISECARVLKTAGAHKVYGLTIAKTPAYTDSKHISKPIDSI